MRRVAPILFTFAVITSCAVDKPMLDKQPPLQTFGSDTFYTGIVAPYTTPEECEADAPNPVTCHLELGFCANGTAGFSNFDLPKQGSYHLDGPIVVASFPEADIQLDTRTGSATVDAQTPTYVLDTVGRWSTLQFDAGIDCTAAP